MCRSSPESLDAVALRVPIGGCPPAAPGARSDAPSRIRRDRSHRDGADPVTDLVGRATPLRTLLDRIIASSTRTTIAPSAIGWPSSISDAGRTESERAENDPLAGHRAGIG